MDSKFFKLSLKLVLFLFPLCSILLAGTLEEQVLDWKEISKEKGEGYQVITLEVESLGWRKETEVDYPFWTHPLRVTIPDKVEVSEVLLFVKGGDRSKPLPPISSELVEGAVKCKAIFAELFSVPNQPLKFEGDSQKREDQLVAYSWRRFLDGGKEDWPLNDAMASAVVASLDSLEAFLKDKTAPKGFVLTGESKRGWASYLAAAKDRRIKAIVPVVADFLNVKENFLHHLKSLGCWSPVIKDYLDQGINEVQFQKDRFQALMEIEDPFYKKDKLLLPKYLIHASGDPFSMPDGTRTYLSGLIGPTFLRLIPNCGHKVVEKDYYPSLFAFFGLVASGSPIPSPSFEVKNGVLHVRSSVKPISVRLWSSSSTVSRDFRFDFTTCRWSGEPLESNEGEAIEISLADPEKGWKGQFVELTYQTPFGPFALTTEAYIRPDTFPESNCQK